MQSGGGTERERKKKWDLEKLFMSMSRNIQLMCTGVRIYGCTVVKILLTITQVRAHAWK